MVWVSAGRSGFGQYRKSDQIGEVARGDGHVFPVFTSRCVTPLACTRHQSGGDLAHDGHSSGRVSGPYTVSIGRVEVPSIAHFDKELSDRRSHGSARLARSADPRCRPRVASVLETPHCPEYCEISRRHHPVRGCPRPHKPRPPPRPAAAMADTVNCDYLRNGIAHRRIPFTKVRNSIHRGRQFALELIWATEWSRDGPGLLGLDQSTLHKHTAVPVASGISSRRLVGPVNQYQVVALSHDLGPSDSSFADRLRW